MGYSLWDCKELDTTERLNTAQTIVTNGPPKQRSVSQVWCPSQYFF